MRRRVLPWTSWTRGTWNGRAERTADGATHDDGAWATGLRSRMVLRNAAWMASADVRTAKRCVIRDMEGSSVPPRERGWCAEQRNRSPDLRDACQLYAPEAPSRRRVAAVGSVAGIHFSPLRERRARLQLRGSGGLSPRFPMRSVVKHGAVQAACRRPGPQEGVKILL